MPRKTHDTTVNEALQATPCPADEWATEVVTRLPGNVQHQARVLKAFERSRQIRSATDLLRGVLAYVYTVHSFQHLSIWSVLAGVADVSATDWRKRLQRASTWLSWLLQEVLAVSTAVSPWLVRGGWRRILLIDGTHFKCPGPLGMVWRVHTAFDLLAGRLTQLKVTDRQEGEHLEVFDLQAGDLVITDRANGLRQRIVFVLRKGADLVVRFTPHNLPLQEAPGKPLDVVRWLKGCRAPAGRVVSRWVWISYQGQQFAVRCIGLRLSEQQRAAAERRKKRTASKKQRQVQADTLYLAGWVLLVTTLPSEHWSAQQVLRLYQARWHIELGAEADQTALEAAEPAMLVGSDGAADNHGTLAGVGFVGRREHCHPCGDARCHALHASLAEGQSLMEQEALQACWWQDGLNGPLSEWMVAEVSVDLLCQQIRGSYTAARYRACLPQLQRFLCVGHRKRPHLYSLICRWLGMPASALGERAVGS